MKTPDLSLVCVILASGMLAAQAEKAEDSRPDIIYIYTDQQHAKMMSCAGNRFLETPAMDYMAENGIRFTRAYTTNPVCSPARVSMMTGRFPGTFRDQRGMQARENRGAMRTRRPAAQIMETTLGAYMRKSGYELVFGGKRHLPSWLSPEVEGFRSLTKSQRRPLAEAARDFVAGPHDRPYLMIVSLINPHDICYMAIKGWGWKRMDLDPGEGNEAVRVLAQALRTPPAVSEEEFFARHCPPLPANHEPQKDEPRAIRSLLAARGFRLRAREKYTDRDWRLHRWAYARLTERVDSEIQMILDAVRKSGREEKTLIMLSSDHGDMDSAHRMEHKTALYEEAANVPFVAMWKGRIPPGRVDDEHMVSTGLDFLPTVCDYAGVPDAVADPRGRSLRPLFEGRAPEEWRPTLGVESEIGRMVVSDEGHKYIRYDADGLEEQLLDLSLDPHETRQFADESSHRAVLKRLRTSYETEWFPADP